MLPSANLHSGSLPNYTSTIKKGVIYIITVLGLPAISTDPNPKVYCWVTLPLDHLQQEVEKIYKNTKGQMKNLGKRLFLGVVVFFFFFGKPPCGC